MSSPPRDSRPSDAETIRLLDEVYMACRTGVESFELGDRVGADLAYLMGAILHYSSCSWPAREPILAVLRERLPAGHAVWRYIAIED